MQPVWPSKQHLPGYVEALERCWSPDSSREADAVREELQKISAFVEITTDLSHLVSRRVIEANGGVLFEQFVKPAQFGSTDGLRYRISLE